MTATYATPPSNPVVARPADGAGWWPYGHHPGSGQLASASDPANRQTTHGRASGDLTRIADPNDRMTGLTHAVANRAPAFALGQGCAVAVTYSIANNAGAAVATDANNHATTYSCDAQGRLTQVANALSNSVRYRWTADNHMQQVTDAKGPASTYQYSGIHTLRPVRLPTCAATTRAQPKRAHASVARGFAIDFTARSRRDLLVAPGASASS